MLVTRRAKLQERRGVALILILGMLGLLALIGVTFATFTGQSRIGARNYAQSVARPQASDVMDFALSQLIGDTDDVRSAIRGHSMARDMYGNDADRNGFVASNPYSDTGLQFTDARLMGPTDPHPGTVRCITNIPLASSSFPFFYGYDFTRWTVKFVSSNTGTAPDEQRLIAQTFEILVDDGTGAVDADYHVFYLSPPPPSAVGARTGYLSPDSDRDAGYTQVVSSQLIGEWAGGVPTTVSAPAARFVLDGRAMHAFNGPGLGTNALFGNMRYNGGQFDGSLDRKPGEPNAAGMDEDYDACDLENWFLAIQSADGKVIVPSFHRPGVLEADDWVNLPESSLANRQTNTERKSKILRPRAADNHNAQSFPNLRPGATTGTIEYDVDNDGDGLTDSVWVDLGYPATKDSRGILFKPLFAFMVIGLNGRIPLNTAGNVQLRTDAGIPRFMSASHLGNSPSEVDPTYGLQNAPGYSQVDNAGTAVDGDAAISVNVTQLRNILAGVRSDPYAAYGDTNIVPVVSPTDRYPKLVPNQANTTVGYPLPNNVYDIGDAGAARSPVTIPGRWGEAGIIPGVLATGAPLVYTNPVRAGLSSLYDATSQPGVDGMDDNGNTLDYWPNVAAGERSDGTWPADYYDAAGDFVIAAERMRRFVTPVDLAGDGEVLSFMPGGGRPGRADDWGRVAYRKYHRPPGVPVATRSGVSITGTMYATTAGEPSAVTAGNPVDNTAIDVTNNALHGFEAQRNPLMSGVNTTQALRFSATPTNLDVNGNPVPAAAGGNTVPTYDRFINTQIGSGGLNEADELSLYQPQSSDQAFGFADLEWLYRAHDQDGSSLSSRLSELAPLSFRDSADALRRRRLYSIDVWDTNSIAWANDNVGNYFPNNHRFGWPTTADYAAGGTLLAANSGMRSLSDYGATPYVAAPTVNKLQSNTPAVAHRERKINLNFPLPVSNSPDEPTRRKWITETYQYLKTILPPQSIDTPEELAQLSQFVVNIVDFRDPDATMTRFRNPDVRLRPGTPARGGYMTAPAAPSLVLATEASDPSDIDLIQYGMEYNPVALNEVLAYSYMTKIGGGGRVSRFYLELVNVLSQASGSAASQVNLAGFNYVAGGPPYSSGCWDLIFTEDDPALRPDPFTGQLLDLKSVPPSSTNPGVYAPVPLVPVAFTDTTEPVLLEPLAPVGPDNSVAGRKNYFYTIGSNEALAPSDQLPPRTGYPTMANTGATAVGPSLVRAFGPGYDPMETAPPSIDFPLGVLPKNLPTGNSGPAAYPGHIPPPANPTENSYKWVCLRRPANPLDVVSDTNPMVVVDAMRFHFIEGTGPITQPDEDMVPNQIPDINAANRIYSTQRFQPFRGGHLVMDAAGALPTRPLDKSRYGFTEQIQPPMNVSVTSTTTTPEAATITDGFDTYGRYVAKKDPSKYFPATHRIFNTLGQRNKQVDMSQTDNSWDHFVFNDRDFTSVAELSLVPGCPPGLFTKLFTEFAPTAARVGDDFSTTRINRVATPPASPTPPANLAQAMTVADEPHTYPYLVQQLHYTSANDNGSSSWNTIYGPSSGGWYKMFEVFEVPSSASGAVASAANGFNYDWYREDVRPGQINLNLIIDEEVFLALMGNAGQTNPTPALQQVIVYPPSLNSSNGLAADGNGVNAGAGYLPLMVTEWDPVRSAPTVLNPTAPARWAATPPNNVGFAATPTGASFALREAYSDFLKIRHGGTGYMFGPLPEAPFRSLTFPDIAYTIMRPAFPTANRLASDQRQPLLDAGVRNPNLQASAAGVNLILPPAVPPRRLFQIPDKYYASVASNANVNGEIRQLGYSPSDNPNPQLSQGLGNLTNATAATGGLDHQAMHPYWRSEWMQKMMNLSTVRTHQYAVWITVGYFEVTSQGDPSQAWGTNPDAAYDVIGREVGLAGDRNARQRGFFIVDRLKLDGFDPSNPGKYRDAVVHRRIIQ